MAAKKTKDEVLDETNDEANEVVSVEYNLDHPIKAYGKRVTKLTFRKPNGADLIEVGNPVKFDPVRDPPDIDHDMKRMAQMLARLSNVPTASIATMDPQELLACAWLVTPFFLPALGARS